ncbi:GTP-binding protein [Fulvivirgaceae bacterium BMA10]|uniref:GTP-binding protein n=1 Tax=Splendidivirga corallicola TaxID=3051826 RepID=A0ABT8KXL2_9BACT|nr:GTP-binding protein [Fulvivirgaceae bacterium BMA10]
MKTRLIIVGGFLGAGKTTLLSVLGRLLRERGEKVGLITNDQTTGLVDTYTLSAHDFAVEEIAGSCFLL